MPQFPNRNKIKEKQNKKKPIERKKKIQNKLQATS